MLGLAYKAATRVLPLSFFELQQLREAQNSFRDAGVAFIHVPKTAGFSVVQTLYRRTLWCHFTLAELINKGAPDVLELPRFAVVRNPWDRLVSAYHFARQGGVPDAAQMQHPERYRGPDFATFDTFVRRYIKTHDVRKLDGVFRPQTYYLGPDARNTVDHIGYFDRLPETEEWLSNTLGRPIRLTQTNSTTRSEYRAYYCPATRDIVAKAYRSDIERFGFDF